jgi:hypothetical protein
VPATAQGQARGGAQVPETSGPALANEADKAAGTASSPQEDKSVEQPLLVSPDSQLPPSASPGAVEDPQAAAASDARSDSDSDGGSFMIFVIGLLCGLTVVLSSLAIYNFLSHEPAKTDAEAKHDSAGHGDTNDTHAASPAATHGESTNKNAPADKHGAADKHEAPAKAKSH